MYKKTTKLYRKIDIDGFYEKDEYSTQIIDSEFYIEGNIPDKLFKPKWNGAAWVEGLSEEEAAARVEAYQQAQARTANKRKAEKHLKDKQLNNYLLSEQVPQEEKDLFVLLYDEWQPGQEYSVGEMVSHNDTVYEVIQAHQSQDGWQPETVPALFKQVYQTSTSDGTPVIPNFVQPAGEHDAYNIGDQVMFKGDAYESTIDGNVWSPEDNPTGWSLVE